MMNLQKNWNDIFKFKLEIIVNNIEGHKEILCALYIISFSDYS